MKKTVYTGEYRCKSNGAIVVYPFCPCNDAGHYEFTSEDELKAKFKAYVEVFKKNPSYFGFDEILSFEIFKVVTETVAVERFAKPITPTAKRTNKPNREVLASAFGI